MKEVNISFSGLHDLPFHTAAAWIDSQKSPLEFFTGRTTLDGMHVYQQGIIADWLSCLNDISPSARAERDINFVSFRQYIDALVYLEGKVKAHGQNTILVQDWARVCAIMETEPRLYNALYRRGQLGLTLDKETERINKDPFVRVYPVGATWLELIQKKTIETHRQMESIPPKQEEIQAGAQRLDKFARYSMYDSLADGDITKHAAVLALPLAEVLTKLIQQNNFNAYKTRLQKVYLEQARTPTLRK